MHYCFGILRHYEVIVCLIFVGEVDVNQFESAIDFGLIEVAGRHNQMGNGGTIGWRHFSWNSTFSSTPSLIVKPGARSPKSTSPKASGTGVAEGADVGQDVRRAGRELLEGYLPLVRTWWVDGPIYYEQSTILDKLDANLGDVRVDDPTVLLMQVRMVNLSDSKSGAARLHLTSRAAKGEKLAVQGDRVLAMGADRPRLRYLFETDHRGRLAEIALGQQEEGQRGRTANRSRPGPVAPERLLPALMRLPLVAALPVEVGGVAKAAGEESPPFSSP